MQLEIGVYPPETLFFRQAVADGEYAGKKFEVSTNIGGGSMIVRFEGEEWFTLTPGDFVTAVFDFMKATEESVF